MWDSTEICEGIVTYFITLSTPSETVLASVAIKNFMQFTFIDLMSSTSYVITMVGANEFGNGTSTTIIVTTGEVLQGIQFLISVLKIVSVYCYQ